MAAQDQPLIQQGNLTYLGSFTLPSSDGSAESFPNNSLTYGGVIGMGPDGDTLIFGMHSYAHRVCEISIPAIGGVASIVTPGRYVPVHETFDVPPATTNIGASICWNGRVLITGYVYYDTAPVSPYSWYTLDSNLTQGSLAGPFAMNPGGGLTGKYLGIIPAEWRELLGGSAVAGASGLSIITRSSRGPVFAVFNPDHIGPVTAVATKLLHYEPPQTMPVPPSFGNSDNYGGLAFPTGWRSVLYIRRHGDTECYGTGAECGDPTNAAKGSHAYPYRHEVLAYDVLDLLAVKAGNKQPWEVAPYATWTLTEMVPFTGGTGWARMRSSTYDIATRRWYITPFDGTSFGSPRIHVYEVDAPGSASASPSASTSPSASASRSNSPSASISLSVSPSASVSRSASASASASVSPSPSPSAGSSQSASVSPSSSASPSSSVSPSISRSPSSSPSASFSPSASASPSAAAPVDAVMGPWSEWGPYLGATWTPCAGGQGANGTQSLQEVRTRSIITPAENGGVTGDTQELRTSIRTCKKKGRRPTRWSS